MSWEIKEQGNWHLCLSLIFCEASVGRCGKDKEPKPLSQTGNALGVGDYQCTNVGKIFGEMQKW